MNEKAMGLLTVNTVSKLANISAHSLRAWERRYSAVTPQRSSSGRRAYTVKDVERLRLLKSLVDNGFSIGKIAQLPEKELLGLTAQIQRTSPSPKQPSSEPVNLPAPKMLSLSAQAQQSPAIQELLRDLFDFKLDKLARHLYRARNQSSPRDFVINFIAPLLREVGHLVSIGELSISQEHALSAVIRDQVSQLQVLNMPSMDADSPIIALATPEGNLHEFGILLSNVLCRHHGIHTHYFGANLPSSALAEALNALNTSHLILGNAPIPPELEKVTMTEYLGDLLSHLNSLPEIWIGGRAQSNHLPRFKGVNLKQISSFEELDNTLAQISEQTRGFGRTP